MKSLCTCAALAVATAFAHEHFADAFLRSSQVQREEAISETKFNKTEDCTAIINDFRGSLGGEQNYKLLESETPEDDSQTDLGEFFSKSPTCKNLQDGAFAHIGGEGIFVITAPKAAGAAARAQRNEACTNALNQWRSGFQAFKNGDPPEYKDSSKDGPNDGNVYANPNAAALVSLLQKEGQTLICGTLTDCPDEIELLCYFKNSKIEEKAVFVDPKLWHALEGEHNLRPKLKLPDKVENGYKLDAVNEARKAVELEQFKVPEKPQSLIPEKRASEPDALQQAIEKFLYGLTCDDLSKPNLSSAQPDVENFTVIYYIKDVEGEATSVKTPTLQDAVNYWKEGFKTLQYKRPPAFKKEELQREQVSDGGEQAKEKSNIYNDSAVAGYASIMADGVHDMACVVVSGCKKSDEASPLPSRSFRAAKEASKSGLICVIHKATLKENVRPISQKTWNKIMRKEGHPIPDFKQLDASTNCLQEMNAVRTQEKLNLKPFAAPTAQSRTETELVLSSVMESVTCKAIGGEAAEPSADSSRNATTGPQFKITDGTTSLMYHTYTGTETTCSAVVEAWKKGSEKFTAAPPAYTSTEAAYKDAAATNFVSLISEGEKTVTCYSTNCTKNGIVCELSPAALRENETPVLEATWTKYTAKDAEGEGQGAGAGAGGSAQPESSGVAGFSKAALVGTVVMTLAGGVLFL